MGESQPVLSNMEVVAESWVKGNDLLLGLISKLEILEGLARGDSIPQGKTGDVERDVVKNVGLKTGSIYENNARFNIEDQNRLKAEGDDERGNTRGLIGLMLMFLIQLKLW